MLIVSFSFRRYKSFSGIFLGATIHVLEHAARKTPPRGFAQVVDVVERREHCGHRFPLLCPSVPHDAHRG